MKCNCVIDKWRYRLNWLMRKLLHFLSWYGGKLLSYICWGNYLGNTKNDTIFWTLILPLKYLKILSVSYDLLIITNASYSHFLINSWDNMPLGDFHGWTLVSRVMAPFSNIVFLFMCIKATSFMYFIYRDLST